MKQIQLESFWHFPGRSSWDLQKLNLPWRWWNLPRPWWMHLKSCQQVGSHKKWMKIHHKDYMDHLPKETLIFWLSKQGELMIWPRKLEGCYHHDVLWQKNHGFIQPRNDRDLKQQTGQLKSTNTYRWIYVYLHGFTIFLIKTWKRHDSHTPRFEPSVQHKHWGLKLMLMTTVEVQVAYLWLRNHRGVTSNSCLWVQIDFFSEHGLYH